MAVLVQCALVWASLLVLAEAACRWETGPAGGESSLVCDVRTLQNGEWDAHVSRMARVETAQRLHIQCSDVLFFESALEARTLARTPDLRELSVSGCKVREIGAGALQRLHGLRRLSVRTHNTDWPAMALSLTADSLQGLRDLRHLDLSDNSLLQTPAGLLCPLSSLQTLDLSRNRLQDVLALQLDGCVGGQQADELADLHAVDLSHNSIGQLAPGSLAFLKNVQTLQLQHNQLVSLSDGSLHGLANLRHLNLSSNRLQVLPPHVLRPCAELRELDLSDNALHVLAPGSFSGLAQLQLLDLSANQLTAQAVHGDTLRGLVRLVVLDVSRNALQRLDGHLLQDLSSLQVLRLARNHIVSVDAGALASLYNLHTLDLSRNRLEGALDQALLSGLSVLSSLSLAHNGLQRLDADALRNCTGLRDLDVSHNALTRLPAALGQLGLLKSLDLSANRLTALEAPHLANLPQLYSLDVSGNAIERVDKEALSGLANLVALDLSSNRLAGQIETGALDGCAGLQVLRLDDNQLTDVNGLLSPLTNLRWLNVSANRLRLFDYSLLPANVEWLDLHQNDIAALSNFYGVRLAHLQAIDASHNRLTSLSAESVPDALVQLFVNDNVIESVAPNTFLRCANLSRLDLNSNRLSTLEPAALWLTPVPEQRDLPEVSLGDNPWLCDCALEWLPALVQPSSNSRQQPRLVDAADVTCQLTFQRRSPGALANETQSSAPVALVDLRPEDFLCPYEMHCFALCHCCEFYACDCDMKCPHGCRCFHDPTWSANIVDCSADVDVEPHTSLPLGIPMDATALYLDGNALSTLPSHALIGRKNLRQLYLNGSRIAALQNRTFNGLVGLQVLELSDNLLEEVREGDLDPLEQLRELRLSRNRLRYVAEAALAHLRDLRVLALDGNRLVAFALWRLSANAHLGAVYLADNPFSCDCRAVAPLLTEGAQERFAVADWNQLRCVDGRRLVALTQLNATCRQQQQQQLQHHQAGRPRPSSTSTTTTSTSTTTTTSSPPATSSLPWLVCVAASLCLAGAAAAVLVVFRRDVRVWLHWRHGVRLGGSSASSDAESAAPLWDAFVAYSLKDEALVTRALAAQLERGPRPLRLCLQHRDFSSSSGSAGGGSAGGGGGGGGSAPAAGDPLTLGLAASKRVVLVVSRAFVESEWTRPEVRAALTGFLRRPRRRPVAVLLGDVTADQADVDAQLSRLLRHCRCVNWNERRFWPKLRYALPDPPQNHLLNHHNHHHLHHHHQTAHYLHQNLQLATAAHAPKPLPATPPGAAKLYAGHAAEPVPRRYTATPQMSHDLHDLQDDALRCYSRLDHSYMSIDHRDVEHIYSCVDHVNPLHHHHHHHQQQQQQQHHHYNQHQHAPPQQQQQQHQQHHHHHHHHDAQLSAQGRRGPDCWSYGREGLAAPQPPANWPVPQVHAPRPPLRPPPAQDRHV